MLVDRIENRAYQKAIRQAGIQIKHNIRNDADRLGVDEELVSERSWGKHERVTGEVSVIDVGNRLNVEVDRSEYSHEREHGHSVGQKTPPDTLRRVIHGVKQGAHTLEEQNDDNS